MADDRRRGKDRRVGRWVGAALIEAPDGLGPNFRVRRDAKVCVLPDALDEELLRRELTEKLKTITTWSQDPVELPTALKRKLRCRIDGVVWAGGWGGGESGIAELPLGKNRHYRHGVDERRGRRAAAQHALAWAPAVRP